MSALDPSTSYGKPPLTFEFTKRKRWADLLVAELADGINMILSTSRKVMYCGPAITELIGWKDTEFLDCDLLNFITPDGQDGFTASFEESIQKNTELLTYVRLKCSDSMFSSSELKDIPFEIKGHPHVMSEHEQDGRCFFASAKAYPSRNTAMLNTYLDLKTENEQLQKRLLELRSRMPLQTTLLGPLPLASQSNPIYATSSLQSQRVLPAPVVPSQGVVDVPNSYYPTTSVSSASYDDSSSSTGSLFDNNTFNTGSIFAPSIAGPSNAEDDEDGSKKKKLKKSHVGEQYVCITCGRTDSPEWRKGPLGPKTLCNACGLRWAKQMRKTDDSGEGGAEASGS